MKNLTIFYDGTCPICAREMRALKQYDKANRIILVDIFHPDFEHYPQIDAQKAATVLHALDEYDRLWLGLDVTYQAWKLVGKGWMYAPLRWPVIRIFADMFYNIFAKHRYTISYWLTGKKRTCDRCVPGDPNGE